MNFSHKMLVYLTTTTPNIADPVLQGWSTEQGVNDFLGEYLSVPVVRVRSMLIWLVLGCWLAGRLFVFLVGRSYCGI